MWKKPLVTRPATSSRSHISTRLRSETNARLSSQSGVYSGDLNKRQTSESCHPHIRPIPAANLLPVERPEKSLLPKDENIMEIVGNNSGIGR